MPRWALGSLGRWRRLLALGVCWGCTSTPPAPVDAGAPADLVQPDDRPQPDDHADVAPPLDAPAQEDVVSPVDLPAPADTPVVDAASDTPDTPGDQGAADDRSAPADGAVGDAGASGCGGPGQRCCALDTCAADGCCTRGRCLAQGDRCADGSVCQAGSCGSCGGSLQPCCAVAPQWTECTAGRLRCWDRACRSCGAAGEVCCPGDRCGDGGCCVEGRCTAQGELCRPGDGSTAGTCQQGRCDGCGGEGQMCCGRTGPFGSETAPCATGLLCYSPMPPLPGGPCRACGGVGQPCCADARCDTGCCSAERQGTCVAVGASCGLRGLGVCRADGTPCDMPCGGPGQPCCAGNTCQQGGCCVVQAEPTYFGGFGYCVAAGAACGPGQQCAAGSCGACGGPGQPCCAPAPPLVPHCTAPNVACTTGCTACGRIGQPCCRDAFGGCSEGACRVVPGRVPCPTCPPEPATISCER